MGILLVVLSSISFANTYLILVTTLSDLLMLGHTLWQSGIHCLGMLDNRLKANVCELGLVVMNYSLSILTSCLLHTRG